MSGDLATRWQPLGTGRQTPAGALTDARLTEQIAAKNALQEAGAQVAERMLPKIVAGAKGKRTAR